MYVYIYIYIYIALGPVHPRPLYYLTHQRFRRVRAFGMQSLIKVYYTSYAYTILNKLYTHYIISYYIILIIIDPCPLCYIMLYYPKVPR